MEPSIGATASEAAALFFRAGWRKWAEGEGIDAAALPYIVPGPAARFFVYVRATINGIPFTCIKQEARMSKISVVYTWVQAGEVVCDGTCAAPDNTMWPLLTMFIYLCRLTMRPAFRTLARLVASRSTASLASLARQWTLCGCNGLRTASCGIILA